MFERFSFLIVDLSFQGQWDLFQVPCQPRSSGGFACLGSHPGLANCTGASIEGVIVARCTGCSSKLCSLFDPLQPDLYSRQGVLVVRPICTQISTAKAAAGQWDLFQIQVRRQPPCSGGFVCLGRHRSSLANCAGATIKSVMVQVARCTGCSSKLCRLFNGTFWIGSVHIYNGCRHPLN